MKEFITVAVYSYPHEITIIKHLLEEAGLSYFFENETMTSIVPMYSYAIGGIKLKVHPHDIEEVKSILKNFEEQNNLRIV